MATNNQKQQRQQQQQHQLPLYSSCDLDAEEAEGAVLRQIESRQITDGGGGGGYGGGSDGGNNDDNMDNIMTMYRALHDDDGDNNDTNNNNGSRNGSLGSVFNDGRRRLSTTTSSTTTTSSSNNAPHNSNNGTSTTTLRSSFKRAVRKAQAINAMKKHLHTVRQIGGGGGGGNAGRGGGGDGDNPNVGEHRRQQQQNGEEEMDGLMKQHKKDEALKCATLNNKLDHKLLQVPIINDDGDDNEAYSNNSGTATFWKCCYYYPMAIFKQIAHALRTSLCLWLAVPLAAGAFVLFYCANDPEVIDFLPGEATLSWWMNFTARLCVTLELAYLTQYALIDGFLSAVASATRRRTASQQQQGRRRSRGQRNHASSSLCSTTTGTGSVVDPLVTLVLLQSKGWPFCSAVWSLLNMILLQGDNQFQRHWLFFLGWDIYSSNSYDGADADANYSSSSVVGGGDYILESEIYLRLLVSGIVVGTLTSLKRTYVALYFGGQQLKAFQLRLETILADTVILNEVAILASTAANSNNTSTATVASFEKLGINNKLSGILKTGLSTVTDEEANATNKKKSYHRAFPSVDFGAVNAKVRVEDKGNDIRNDDERRSTTGNDDSASDSADDSDSGGDANNKSMGSGSSSDNLTRIKRLLERWDVPTNKRNKSLEKPTINDILRFRRALTFCDNELPFGKEFGPASNRDECIQSSHLVFSRLLDLVVVPAKPDDDDDRQEQPQSQECLPFSVLAELAYDCDEMGEDIEDTAKLNLIRRRFRPDASGNLSLFAFIQSCDSIYKRLRYFRASLDNASVISNVLERVTNAIFFFILILLIISVMKINPWNVLLPLTSLLVSFSFALGASISHAIEGILLIAVRRPYDLGDRIFFSSTEGINPEPNVTSKSWFVEDITLTTTTLRYSRTNEVSTVANWSIASSRIVNCNHSPLATVFIEAYMHESIFDDGNLTKFRAALNKYVADRPRTWDSVSYCRHDEFDAINERVKFAISVRHRNSWQDAARIKTSRADLVRFLHEKSKEMNVHYDEPPPQQVLYYGGKLKVGDFPDGYKRELLSLENIHPPGPTG